MRQPVAAWLVAVLLAAAGGTPAAVTAAETPLGPRVAATANGQTIAAIDDSRRAIVAFDASRPDARRDLVGPAAADAATFVAVGYLTGDVVAAVCRAGDDWSLCTYRTAPEGPVDAGSPLQRIPLGTASGDSARVDLAVSHARGWLAVTGLPVPLPPVTVSPADELVLVLRVIPADSVAPEGGDVIAFFDLGGRELLRLPAGLQGIGGLDFGRGDTALWAAASDPAGRSGLWRLDAAFVAGRQVIRPELVAPLESPRDLVSSSPRAIVVVHGGSPNQLSVIDPTVPADRHPPGGEP